MAAVGRHFPPPCLLVLLPSLLLIICQDGEATEEGGGLHPSSPGDNGDPTGPDPVPTAESRFALKVLVLDSVTQKPLPGASVSVYLNHTMTSSAQTEHSGEVIFWIEHRPQLSLTLLGNKRGYVPRPVPWSTSRRPVLSVVTLLLLPHAQGNIWLFEDSVLITGKRPGTSGGTRLEESSSHPKVMFPKKLLITSSRSNITSVTAYLTVPQHHQVRDCTGCTPGLVGGSGRSALRSVSLNPVVSVSILLFCDEEQLQIRGPIQISVPLKPGLRLRAADTVPAWAFNFNMGAWENQGLGVVKRVGDELIWTYTASHLGHWIAAPLPSSESHLGYRLSLDFVWYHTYLLMATLGGMLLIVIGFLSLLVCHCRRSHQGPRRRTARFTKLTVVKKDQTTSTHMEGGLLYRSGDNSLASRSIQCEASSVSRPNASFNIYVEDPAASFYENIPPDQTKGSQPLSHYINGEEVTRLREKSEQNNVNSNIFFPDKLINIFNQAVAVIQAPELFGTQEQQLSGCKSATFPRNGGEYNAHPEPASKDGFTQMLAKVPVSNPSQTSQDEPRALETPPQSQEPSAGGWGRYSNLLESSVSVPGTLNEAAGLEAFRGGHGVPRELQGISERTLLELTRGKPLLSHPRAWFVSLDGKPAAQVRHSIIELQSSHRPPSSNDTSLDSGVDMNEPLQNIREMERDRPLTRASSLSHHSRGGRCSEEQDLSSSESGTTATCTPEDPSLRNILDGSIPEEHDEMDTSSAREDSESRAIPPSRRLRKMREKVKTDCKQAREGRPQIKRS